ncbi:MAG: Mercuric transport protein periplasmic component precursor [Chlorobi bacterium OLB5]|nr:MAG: Mercuric transport protein periplasmic component precursor [Chlorobi bacterium OLB5]
MKIIKLLIIILALTAINITLSNHNTKKMTLTETETTQKVVKIKCTEMSCDACKRSITKSINQLKGIKSLDINLETKIITVIIDDKLTDEQSVLNAVIGAGYEAELIF